GRVPAAARPGAGTAACDRSTWSCSPRGSTRHRAGAHPGARRIGARHGVARARAGREQGRGRGRCGFLANPPDRHGLQPQGAERVGWLPPARFDRSRNLHCPDPGLVLDAWAPPPTRRLGAAGPRTVRVRRPVGGTGRAGAGEAFGDSQPRLFDTAVRWWHEERLVQGWQYLGDVAREVGYDRFLRFWNSTEPVDTALATALKMPVGKWTERWERRFLPR